MKPGHVTYVCSICTVLGLCAFGLEGLFDVRRDVAFRQFGIVVGDAFLL